MESGVGGFWMESEVLDGVGVGLLRILGVGVRK